MHRFSCSFSYGEGKFAKAFSDSWRNVPFGRVVVNEGAVVKGGLADSNNALEVTNAKHKFWARLRKSGDWKLDADEYAPELAQ